jgi:2,4-dienoyl-CoA reductase-like NADH-dependent reductase (Old Yellow Enzyme family)
MVARMIGSSLALSSGVVLRNRIAKAAMTEAMSPDGDPSDALIALYAAWAAGGPGLLLTGNVMVDRRYLERIGNVVFDARTDVAKVRRWAEASHADGAAIYAQLSHPGRQTNLFIHPKPVAPSAVAAVKVMRAFGKPRALTEAEIEEILTRIVGAAALAQTAGLDGVQIHAAHGYLISQFLSPLTNQRQDAWGGAIEGRARFLLEAIRRVRAKVGSRFGIAVKLNSADFQRGGFSNEDALAVIRLLANEGIDFLEISGGNYESVALLGYEEDGTPRKHAREAYFLDFAKMARGVTSLPLMLTGGLRSRPAMDEALNSGAVDLIGIARPFCVQPDVARALLASPNAAVRAFEIPKLGIAAMEGQGETDWCNVQMRRIAQGQAPDLKQGVRWNTMGVMGGDAFRGISRRWGGNNLADPA